MKKLLPIYFLIALAGLFPTRAPADDLARGLVGWWRLDGNLTDASGNGNHGTVGAGSAAYAAGVYGQAWDNDATRYASVSPGIPMTENMTFAFWIRRTASGSFALISRRNGFAPGYTVFLLNDVINFDFRAASNAPRWNTGWTAPANTWAHVVIIRTPSVVRLFVNASQQSFSSDSNAIGSVGEPTGSTNIGATGNDASLRFVGQLANLMIYNRALTPSEIRALYALGSPIGLAP